MVIRVGERVIVTYHANKCVVVIDVALDGAASSGSDSCIQGGIVTRMGQVEGGGHKAAQRGNVQIDGWLLRQMGR
eukprot:11160253-Lingulodinium_polyedra.AAC.1